MPAGVNKGFPGVPEMEADETEHRRKIARVLNNAVGGRINCTVTVTLRASQTTTTVTDPRISATSFLMWMPTTANASTAEKAGIYVSARGNGTATLTHASNAAVDQSFTILILG
jgi:hypothetical protein